MCGVAGGERPRPSWILASILTAAAAISDGQRQPATRAFGGATIFDGSGAPAIPNGVLVVRDGRIVAVGPAAKTTIPEGAERVDVAGRFIIPGLINAHGHIGSADGLQTGAKVNTDDNVRRQLALNARYGVTTVVSLATTWSRVSAHAGATTRQDSTARGSSSRDRS